VQALLQDPQGYLGGPVITNPDKSNTVIIDNQEKAR
jgi:hypothetical protein